MKEAEKFGISISLSLSVNACARMSTQQLMCKSYLRERKTLSLMYGQ